MPRSDYHKVGVVAKTRLCLTAAMAVAHVANHYPHKILLASNGKEVDAKYVTEILGITCPPGKEMTVMVSTDCDGYEHAANSMKCLFDNGFDALACKF